MLGTAFGLCWFTAASCVEKSGCQGRCFGIAETDLNLCTADFQLKEPRAERVKQRKRDSRSGQKYFAAMDFVTYAATAHAYTRLVV
jgi:hypothetical protein